MKTAKKLACLSLALVMLMPATVFAQSQEEGRRPPNNLVLAEGVWEILPSSARVRLIRQANVIYPARVIVEGTLGEWEALLAEFEYPIDPWNREGALSPTATSPTLRHPNRRMNDAELRRWIEEFNYLGGPNTFELAMVDEVNRLRSVAGLPSLEICMNLMMASRLHSQLMAEHDFFGHIDPFYPDLMTRATMITEARGYPSFSSLGENIGGSRRRTSTDPVWRTADTHSPEAAIHTWQNSAAHWGHIFTNRPHVGFGVVPDASGVYRVTFMTGRWGGGQPNHLEERTIGQDNLWQALPQYNMRGN